MDFNTIKRMIKNKLIINSSQNKQLFHKELDLFFKLLNNMVKTKAYLVVIVLYEYFRNPYPDDTFLKFSENDHKKNIPNIKTVN